MAASLAPELYAKLKAEAEEQKLPLSAEPRIEKAPTGDPFRED